MENHGASCPPCLGQACRRLILVLLFLGGTAPWLAAQRDEESGAIPEPVGGQAAVEAALAELQAMLEPFADADAVRRRVAELAGRLDHEDFLEREMAARDLGDLPPEIAPMLRSAVRGKSREVRARAAGILRRLERKRAGEAGRVADTIAVLLEARDRRVVPFLLELMADGRPTLRYYAAYGIRQASGKSFGFDAHGDAATRAAALGKWRKWWRAQGGSFVFAEPDGKNQPHGLLVADDVGKQLVFLSLEGKVLWRQQLDLVPMAASLLENGNYLVAHEQGACEFNRQHQRVWDNSVANLGAGMIYDIRRLANGNTLMCYVSNGHVTELDRKGKVVWRMGGLDSPGAAQRLANGNTLICENHGNRIFEVNPAKEVVWEHGDLKNPSNVTPLANGNVLVGEWGANRAFEVRRTGKVSWEYQHDGNINGALRLPDGQTVVSQSGALVLVDKKGKVVREIFKSERRYGKVQLVRIPQRLPEP